ncbi:MAG: DUF4190 domain-containing protein, partial [Ruminococcus sp.]|nr:DUF4190 domain-containing protein [Ruminococcus sp.]
YMEALFSMDDYNFNNQNSNDSDGRVNLEKPQNNDSGFNSNPDPIQNVNPNPVQPTNIYNQNGGNMGYNSNFGQPPQQNGNNTLSIVSMVLGIISIVGFCCCTPIGILCGIGGVVTGIISKSQNMGGSGMALAGIITGAVGVVGSIIWMIVGSAFRADLIEEFQRNMESAIHFMFM